MWHYRALRAYSRAVKTANFFEPPIPPCMNMDGCMLELLNSYLFIDIPEVYLHCLHLVIVYVVIYVNNKYNSLLRRSTKLILSMIYHPLLQVIYKNCSSSGVFSLSISSNLI